MFYLVKTPWLLKILYPRCTWEIPVRSDKILYFTFDDGPHPVVTPFVLDELKKYNAKATFFCIGKNVQEHPYLYERILNEGHQTGNHSQNHLNGWKTDNNTYIDDIVTAKKFINSKLFRPPYGRIRRKQIDSLRNTEQDFEIIMWTLLSGDFDISVTHQVCIDRVVENAKNGSIIVFHDSDKAFPRLQNALPVILKKLTDKGYRFEKIPSKK
jgi:peptidoglycan-N-acetylglucosamine deacetylase